MLFCYIYISNVSQYCNKCGNVVCDPYYPILVSLFYFDSLYVLKMPIRSGSWLGSLLVFMKYSSTKLLILIKWLITKYKLFTITVFLYCINGSNTFIWAWKLMCNKEQTNLKGLSIGFLSFQPQHMVFSKWSWNKCHHVTYVWNFDYQLRLS